MKRGVASLAVLAVVVAMLAGCASRSVASFSRSDAQADAARWSNDAVGALAGHAATTTKFSGFERCRSDSGYLPTSSQWRIITDVTVAASGQPAAISAIAMRLQSSGWRASTSAGITTLRGPSDSKRKGQILLQTAGSSTLSISIVSPCYS